MLLGFKEQFVEPIQIGTKVFTLRKRRKNKPKIGETLHMYTGPYNSNRRLISNKEKLVSMQNVRIIVYAINRGQEAERLYCDVYIDRRKLQPEELQMFCRYDGFASVNAFCNYWLTDEKGKKKKRTGALMQLLHWTDLKY
jgi:hypothetical protein